jgi:hypothetical protein
MGYSKQDNPMRELLDLMVILKIVLLPSLLLKNSHKALLSALLPSKIWLVSLQDLPAEKTSLLAVRFQLSS